MRNCLKIHKTQICGYTFIYHLNNVLIENQMALQKTEKTIFLDNHATKFKITFIIYTCTIFLTWIQIIIFFNNFLKYFELLVKKHGL